MTTDIDQLIQDDPLGAVVEQIARVERALSADQIREVAQDVLRGPTPRRRVARELRDNPQVLVTGRAPSIWSVGKLLATLAKKGAQQLATPRCFDCDRETVSLCSRKGGLWVCSGCARPKEECAGCGTLAYVHSRDRKGRPRCQRCPDGEDPTQELIDLVVARDPGVDRATVEQALSGCSRQRAVRRRVAWAVLDQPGLLTGGGHTAPTPSVLAFINALVDAGATVVQRPGCARCGAPDRLRAKRDGQRICWRCEEESRAEDCSRCGKHRKVSCREDDGRPVCHECWRSDPTNHELCTGCGRRRKVKARTGEGPWCQRCSPREDQECSVCGQLTRCSTSRATGEPWCRNCRVRHIRCASCGTVSPLKGGTLAAPLCARCLNPDPDFWDRCPICEKTWQFGTEPCQRCLVDQKLGELLGDGDGVAEELVPFRRALVTVERPDHAMVWLSKPNVRALLTALGKDPRPVTHALLDELPAGKPLNHLRALLVAAGSLPARDERLANLERWTDQKVAARKNLAERRVLHGYAIWHHLRRLRQRLRGQQLTVAQDQNVRVHITAATQFLDDLAGRGMLLSACTQSELDDFMAHRATYPSRTAHFVRWAVAHRHAHNLTAPATRWAGPSGPHDQDKRWEVARRLLHDDGPAAADRVAGLLLLLYAQHVNTIRHLTVDHVERNGDQLTIRLGDRPIVLPAPLDALMEELLSTRRGHTLLDAPGTWLFPGRFPGQPLSSDQLVVRLRALGIQPRQDRATALFTLASQVPAAILARMLGIHRSVAVQWQQASGGDWAAYAADVAARPVRSRPAD
ncbi:site-specific integrase [Streptomyces tailanensis]|uniref:site-specific integrase n=1 Tax=Streptomyces tailanensis TaxID=2569858 RepID=UPI00122E3B33|nr:site-specific integrase [Streptomyces tailanensis]